MEDLNSTEEDQSNQGSHEDTKQTLKESSTSAPFNCVTLRSSSSPSLSPYPAPGGTPVLPADENNAKQTTVANGQVPSAVSVWHMFREVPPRFRNHQEPKIVLKRGQSLDGISPFLHTGNQSNANTTPRSASLTYANSTCGPGSGAPLLSQGMDTIVVDGSDLQAWPSIGDSRRQNESLDKASWECNQGMQKKITEQVELGVIADRDNSESISPSSFETTALNSADAENMQQKVQSQDGAQWEDNMVEKVVGPKQAEADGADDCTGLHVQLPSFSSNQKALTPDPSNRASGEELETGELWGISGDDGVNHEVSQTIWGKERSGLKKQAAIIKERGVPEEGMSGDVKESSPGYLQDSQMITTNTTSKDSEKEMKKTGWEASGCESAGHRSSEDGTCSDNNSRAQASCTEVTLQSMLIRNDLDPRVLCNTGWGQTQIKQSIAWDLEVDSSSESGRNWTEHAKIDLSSPTCSQWSRDLPAQVKGGNSQGVGSKVEHIEEKIHSKQGDLLTDQSNNWVKVHEDEQGGRWNVNRRDCGQRKDGEGGSRGPGDTQWRENKGKAGQCEKSWAESEDEGWRTKQHQGWRDNRHPQHIPNNQTALESPNQQQLQQPRSSQESRDPPTGPVGLNQSSGWKPGPIPHTSSATEPSGWEEPSPQSISRKMEIDDGTSAWGDPAHYDNRSVNMWDKSNLQQRGQPSQHHHEVMPASTLTSRDKNAASSAWEQGDGAPGQVMDNSTSGWGKAFDAPSGWRDSEDSGKGAGWGGSRSSSAKTGSKTMQDSWGDKPVNTSRHSSWEEEDSGSGMWGNRSQDNTSSFSSGGWNQSQGGRRTGAKVPLKGNGGSSWTGPITRQMSNMGITDEEAVSASDRSRRGMNDFNGEMRRGGRGGGSFRSHSSKDPVGTTGVFNTGGVPHLRGVQQPGMHHINPSPGVRAQVPQQFLQPQVSGSVLNPMFPPQLSPQHLAMLSGIHPHMQQVQLAYQLLLQQQQQQQQQQHFLSQRKFPHPPLIQHQDPQQLARIMAVLQQHPKTPPSFPAGFVPGVEPESVIGGVKDVGGVQPQFKWMMEAGHPLCPSPPDPLMLKNGMLPGSMKLKGDSPYPHYDLVGVETMGVASPNLSDHWHRTSGGKLGPAPSTTTWPPEFQPGVPWKGVQSPEPDPIPYSGILGDNPLTDSEHHLLQDNTEMNTVLPSPGAWPYCASDTHNSAKFPTLATSWPPEPIGHRSNRNSSQLPRPPPGLTHQKQSPWLGAGPHVPRGWSSERQSQESPFGTESSWSGGPSVGSSWLLLSNLTPQIDSSTLKTVCLQHGPLMTFNLCSGQSSALIRYCSPEEAAKAQSALHMCVLGNTTILAESVSEEDVARYFAHSQNRETDGQMESEIGGGVEVKPGWENLEGAGLSLFNRWSHSREGGVWGGVASGYHGNNLWGSPQVEDRGPGLLPGNLLGGGADTL